MNKANPVLPGLPLPYFFRGAGPGEEGLGTRLSHKATTRTALLQVNFGKLKSQHIGVGVVS